MMDHYHEMHDGFAGHWIGMVLLAIGLAVFAYGMVRLYGRPAAQPQSTASACCTTGSPDNEALRILQVRLANGSISTDEYEATLKVLRS